MAVLPSIFLHIYKTVYKKTWWCRHQCLVLWFMTTERSALEVRAIFPEFPCLIFHIWKIWPLHLMMQACLHQLFRKTLHEWQLVTIIQKDITSATVGTNDSRRYLMTDCWQQKLRQDLWLTTSIFTCFGATMAVFSYSCNHLWSAVLVNIIIYCFSKLYKYKHCMTSMKKQYE